MRGQHRRSLVVQHVCPAATTGLAAQERAEERDRALLRVLPRNASIAGMHEDSEKTKVGCGVTTEARDRLFSSSSILTDLGEQLKPALHFFRDPQTPDRESSETPSALRPQGFYFYVLLYCSCCTVGGARPRAGLARDIDHTAVVIETYRFGPLW